MRIIFMGTPEISVNALGELVAQGHDIVAVYTQPPRPSGRGKKLNPSPVHEFAENMGIPVYNPINFKDPKDVEIFESHDAELGVVVAYGLLLPKAILEAPEHGCINLHASLLPRWRGAAPIQRAIMAGDKETGLMVMQMDEGLDTGNICLIEHIKITDDMTAGELHDLMAPLGANLLARAVSAIEWGGHSEVEQSEEGVTYAQKIDKAESRINFDQDAKLVHNHIRGLSPFPGAWCEIDKNDKANRIKIVEAKYHDIEHDAEPGTALNDQLLFACKTGAVEVVKLQRAGKQVSNVEEFQRGFAIKAKDRLY